MSRLKGKLLAIESSKRCQTALLLSVTFTIGSSAQASAGDFSRAKQVYVPPSRIIRRVDFASMREEGTATRPPTTSYSHPVSSSPSKTAKVAKTTKTPSKTIKTASPQPSIAHKPALPPPPLNSSPLSSVIRDPGLAAKMEATARSLIKSGRIDEARRLLTQLQNLSPEDQALLKQVSGMTAERAKTLLKQGNVHDALISTREALSADPSNPAAQGLLNQIHKQSGLDPSNLEARLKAAHQLYSTGHYQEAEVEYRATLGIKPTTDAYVGLSKVAAQIHGYPVAKQELEKALEIEPNSAPVRRELGLLHLNQGDVVGANSELSRALILDPKDNVAGNALIKLWQGQVSKLPNANSHLGLARAYQLTGDLASAQSSYRQVVRIDPNHPYLPAARQSFKIALARQEAAKDVSAAKALESQGMTLEAFKRAQRAVSLSPGEVSYRIYQGELLERLGLPSQARDVYSAVLRDDPQNLLAAQKIKGLPTNSVPGVPLTRHPDGFPGTKFPLPVDALPVASTAAGGTPAVPMDHVTTLSNFLGSLRSHMSEQKKNMEAFEDLVKKAQSPAAAAAVPDVTEALHSGGGDDFIEKILHSPVGSALPTKGATAGAGAGAAASALESLPPPVASAPMFSAPSFKSSQTSHGLDGDSAARRMRELEEQNRRLQEEIQSMRTGTLNPQTAPQSAPALTPQSAAPQVAPQLIASAPQAYNIPAAGSAFPASPSAALPVAGFPGVASSGGFAAPSAVTGSLPSQNGLADGGFGGFPGTVQSTSAGLAAAAPSLVPAFIPGQSEQNIPALRGMSPTTGPSRAAADSSSPLKFELREIQPGLTEVKLKVVLRNDSAKNFQIPEHVRAIIKYRDSREAEVRVAFANRTVASGGTVDGLVKVPLSKVDPSADLILKNVLPTSGGDPDLHLITSLVHR